MILKQDLSNHQDIKFWTRCFFFLIFEKTFVNLLTSRIQLWFRKWAPSRSNFFLSLEITVFLNISFLNMFCCSFLINSRLNFFSSLEISIFLHIFYLKNTLLFFFINLNFINLLYISLNITYCQWHVIFCCVIQCCGNLLIFLEQKVLSFHTKNSSIGHFRNLYIFSIRKILKSKKDNNQMELDWENFPTNLFNFLHNWFYHV